VRARQGIARTVFGLARRLSANLMKDQSNGYLQDCTGFARHILEVLRKPGQGNMLAVGVVLAIADVSATVLSTIKQSLHTKFPDLM